MCAYCMSQRVYFLLYQYTKQKYILKCTERHVYKCCCNTTCNRPQMEIAQMSVLVYLGCYNKTPLTGWLINNKLSLLAVLEARKSKVKVLAHSVSGGKGCFLVQGQSTEESINEFVIVLERNSRRQ